MSHQTPERRSFLTRLNASAASLAALALGSNAMAQVKTTSNGRPEAARHEKDQWLDAPSAKHRLIFDTISDERLRNTVLFAGNYIRANKVDYGVDAKDLSVVLVVRHQSTAFGYVDAIWAKYSAPIGARANVVDPKTKEAPKVNLQRAALEDLIKQGVQVAVCATATRNLAILIAQAVQGNVDEINAELIANILPGARMVPAGVVTVSRAQERGYALISA